MSLNYSHVIFLKHWDFKYLDNISERMKSRFVMGLVQDIKEPDYEARYAIVKRKAEAISLLADDEVLSYSARNITSNIRELNGAINKLLMLSKLSNEKITLEIAIQEIAAIITPDKPKEITASDILAVVSEKCNVSVGQLF